MSVLKKSQKIILNYNTKYNVFSKIDVTDNIISGLKNFEVKNKNPKIVGLKDIIIYYTLLNEFNYNFWNLDTSIEPSRSKALNQLFEKFILPNIDDFKSKKTRVNFLLRLKIIFNTYNFKMVNHYKNDIDKLLLINYDNFNKNLDIIITQIFNIQNTPDNYEKELSKAFNYFNTFVCRYFSSYGEDPFKKREKLAFNMILDSMLVLNKKTEKNYIPIDYRIPTILKYLGIIKLPLMFDKFFIDKEMLSKEDELYLRSITFLALNKIKVKCNLSDRDLDKKLFNLYEISLDRNMHFKFFTKAY